MTNKILNSYLYGLYNQEKLTTPILNYYFHEVRVDWGLFHEMRFKREKLFKNK